MTTNRCLLIALIFVLFVSCQKETQKATEQNNAATSLRKSPKSLFEAISQLDFKEDFSIPPRENGEPHNIGPNDFGWSLRKASSSRDKAYLAETFTDAKSKVEDLFARNKDDQYTATIQLVSLKYLRRYILETKSVENQKHALDLLRILVETKAIDLDVLVDAYLFVSPIIKPDEKQRFFDYVSKIHNHDVAIIKEKAPKFMKAYQDSTGNEQKKYLLWGKDLERRSDACAYAREKLPRLTVK